jgi:hypothetical protein
MAATNAPRPGAAPLSEYKFDGSNWQDFSRLVTLARLHRTSGTEVDSDLTQSTWVARQFTGPALDWMTGILLVESTLLNDFNAFQERLRAHFGITDELVLAHQRTQLDALKWRQDAPTFFAEFERLAHACGMGGENSGKVTLLVSKIPDKQRTILARQVPSPTTFAEYRSRLLTLWVNDPTSAGNATDKEAAKPKCGKCGKKGHTASNCHSSIKAEK